MLGELWALEHDIPLETYPANWERYGRTAGLKRNERMAKKADALLAIWDGRSSGTAHMISTARKYKLLVYVHTISVQ